MIEAIPVFNTTDPFSGKSLFYTESIIKINDLLYEEWSGSHALGRYKRDSFINQAKLIIAMLDQNPEEYFLSQYIEHLYENTFLKTYQIEEKNSDIEKIQSLSEHLGTATKIQKIYTDLKKKYKEELKLYLDFILQGDKLVQEAPKVSKTDFEKTISLPNTTLDETKLYYYNPETDNKIKL